MNFKRIGLLFAVAFITLSGSTLRLNAQSAYKNAKLPTEERVQDLLSRMTLEEKVGQLLCPLGWEMYEKKGKKVDVSDKYRDAVKNDHIGMLWATFRADPWTQKTLETGLTPVLSAEAANAMQKYMVENTRLGIPIFLAEEAPHGHMAIGTTVFPTGIGQAATWNPELIESMAKVTAKEVRLQGAHISYGPVLDLSREHRWSRVEETYGEDPVLMGDMAAAIVKGLGGGQIEKPFSTISTLKHFVAYGVPEGGHNGNPISLGERELRQSFLYPFERAVEAGALSVMSAYNSIDGVPCTASKFLLTDVLRDEWKFRGFTVSDLGSIEGIRGSHRVARDHEEAAILALVAGMDVDLGGNAYKLLVNAVNAGKLDPKYIDRSVARVLRLKFEMGLFENPYVKPAIAKKEVKTKDNVALAKEVAQESIVLLENKNNILPLKSNMKVALVGPNADNVYNQLGDYTAPQDFEGVSTVYNGLVAKVGKENVSYVKGCSVRDTTELSIDAAVALAKKSDVIVAVVGGSSARDFKTKYINTGAAVADKNVISDMDSGEGFDRSTLDLLGKQLTLLKELKKTGKPLVVIYIQGRPLNMNWASANADALLTAWYPGMMGGAAITDVLYGDYNPSGRMPISVAESIGQLPVHYNAKHPLGHDYVEIGAEPLYAFGQGKSYTTFNYTDLKITPKGDLEFEVSFKLTNTGQFDGTDVPQLYLRNMFTSVSQANKQLKKYAKVFLRKGESKEVKFVLNANDLSIIDAQMNRVVERNSDFLIQVGKSSRDIELEGKLPM